jgi:hypothetical protein
MSTNSKIAIEQEDGSIVGIYCHGDGYLEGVGSTLNEHWNNPEKLKPAIDLGDASVWGPVIGEKINFADRDESQNCYYGRDRGESNIEPRTYNNQQEYKEDEGFSSFIYLLKNTGEWQYSKYRDENWYSLKKGLEDIVRPGYSDEVIKVEETA